MLVLHAVWSSRSTLWLWAEDPFARLGGGIPRPRSRRPENIHPFAATSRRLAGALAEAGVPRGDEGREGAAVLLLPSSPRGPLGSPAVAVPDRRTKPRLAVWKVPVVEFDPDPAVDVALGLGDLPEPRPAHSGLRTGDSVRFVARAVELALHLAARGRLVPALVDGQFARWLPIPGAEDASLLAALASSIPPMCRSEPEPADEERSGRRPADVLSALVGSVVDVVARSALAGLPLAPPRRGRRPRTLPAPEVFAEALTSPEGAVGGDAGELDKLGRALEEWRSSGVLPAGPLRTCFRVSSPENGDGTWHVDLLLQSTDDPSLLAPASEVWRAGRTLTLLKHTLENPQERLLQDLGHASRLYPELEKALDTARPTAVTTDAAGALSFLRDVAPLLEQAGFGVIVPGWWRTSPRLGLRVKAWTKTDKVAGTSRLGMQGLLDYRYEVALGDETLDAAELRQIAKLKAPLVRVRGQWVHLHPDDVTRALAIMERQPLSPDEPAGQTTGAELMHAALGLADADHGLPVVGVDADGWLGRLLSTRDESRASPVPTPREFNGVLRPYQERGVGWLAFLDGLGLGACLADDMGLGKAQPLDAKVLTPRGWRLMGDIQIGDEIITSKGGRARVVGVYAQGEKDIYRVEFSDGAWTECCDEHLWFVNTPVRRFRGNPPRVLPLREIRSRLRDGAGNLQHFVPLVAPVDFDARDLLIDPYVLGILIGDGALAERVIFSTADPEVVESALVQLGLAHKGAHEKRIPHEYRFASIDQRESLLQGILDSDGHVRPADNHVELTTTSPGLAEDVRELVQSLGGTARLRERSRPTYVYNGERRQGRRAYRLTLALPDSIRPFRLERKAQLYRPRTECPPNRAITRVAPVGRKQARCIAVDAPDQLYVTDAYVLTHNTPQLLALLLTERLGRSRRDAPKPTLLICPMSIVGNWQRESERFAPSLRVHVHHGTERAVGKAFAKTVRGADLVITTYALAARDAGLLRTVAWGRVVCDEAQAIKNPASRQSREIRSLEAPSRIALTGTPVENRLSELWSIVDFCNPGLLGPQATFKTRFAVPIERYRDDDAAARLRRVTQPFILRRLKTDRAIIADLPEKLEIKVLCNLTREQATLYQAIVDDMLAQIEGAEGIKRHGLVLATMMKLKQVCNHPAHFLADGSRLDGRSGKLARLEEILEEVVAEGDRALVFTQFAEMGALLQDHLSGYLGARPPFLHGGVPKRKRDAMVDTFQAGEAGSVFLLSLKAGGVGLNLTAASHVVHFDRWWNPAVEDQATDRAFRIGQRRDVQVRKFVCLGTLEERIDQMIADKRDLAERIVGTGEAWLTQLSTSELHDLVALSRDAVAEG